MTQDEAQNITSRGWNRLYERLDNDGLLPTNVARRPRAMLPLRRAGVVAALILAAAIALWQMAQQTGRATENLRVMHNDESESALAATLEDGSVVYLAQHTSISCPEHFDADKREISLKGVAFFNISSRSRCPFSIDTEPAKIDVTGTAFGLRHDSRTAFALFVREGEVKVTLKKNNQSLRVTAGQAVRLHADRPLTVAGGDEAFSHLWQRIHFKDERLADVARIINLHARDAQVVVAPELADLRLTVAFADNNVHSMAHLICLALNLQYTQHEQIIRISKRTQP